MLGIEEMAAMVIVLLAVEGLYVTYAESTAVLTHKINSFTSELTENEALQKFYGSSMQGEVVIGALRNATGCSAHKLDSLDLCTIGAGNISRVIVSDGYAYAVRCDESTDNA
ncbi:MAG: hypothetical protein ACP5UH_01745 [Candidatus Micrarchaeia archaeon]